MNATPVIQAPRPFNSLAPGVGWTSIPIVFQGNQAGPVDVYNGYGYGFILHSIGNNFAPVLAFLVGGVSKKSNDIMFVVPNVWYKGPFTSLKAVNMPAASAAFGLVGAIAGSTGGSYVLNIGIKDDALADPSIVQGQSATPTIIGGAPPVTYYNDPSTALTRAIPTLGDGTEGAVIGNGGFTQSMYDGYVEAAAGQTITGGSVDVWKYDYQSGPGAWHIHLQGIALPIGQRKAAIPADAIGVRNNYGGSNAASDKLLIAANGVTTSAGLISVVTRIQ